MRFLLNMRILADAFEQANIDAVLYNENTELHLEEVRLAAPCREEQPRRNKAGEDEGSGLSENKEKSPVRTEFVYVVRGEEFAECAECLTGADLIVIGEMKPEEIPAENCVLCIPEERSASFILGFVQDVFAKYREWDWNVQKALLERDPLDKMLLASIGIFKNPMFIHDNNFYILSDPMHIPEMSSWERDTRTGRSIVSLNTINDFRTDFEYLEGLKSKKPVLYSSNQTGYRILYRNLWIGNHYVGRVLADELRSAVRPGNFYEIDYLGKLLEESISSKRLIWLSVAGEFDEFLQSCISDNTVEEQTAMRHLQYLEWELTDCYTAMQIITVQQEFSMVSAYSTIGQIETQLPQSKAFLYGNSIYVVVNLTKGSEPPENFAWRLSVVIRESLLKVGVSSEFHNFLELPNACKQAGIALEFGRVSDSTYWYYKFDDYKLDYIIRCATRELPANMLCADALTKLKEYDLENKTDLYNTLRVYLKLEKNVLQTSKELFIHRSTLAYRLDKIQKIMNLDLNDSKERLKLLISFYIENGSI